MAPLRSHLAYLFDTLRTKRKVSYWFGARSASDLFYVAYFEKLQKDFENFTFHVALSEPDNSQKWNGLTGFIHDVACQHYLKTHGNIHDVEFYLCGPPPMIKASREMLSSIGVSGDQISYDEF